MKAEKPKLDENTRKWIRMNAILYTIVFALICVGVGFDTLNIGQYKSVILLIGGLLWLQLVLKLQE